MKFETKYIFRYGLPGWIPIVFILISSGMTHIKETQELFKNVTLTTALGTSASLILIGIPIGYILYQIYFVLFWVFIKKHDDYFDEEFNFHKKLIGLDSIDKTNFISNRYGHLLNRVNDLGSLLNSLLFTGIVLLCLTFISKDWILLPLDIVVFLLAYYTFHTYKYFSKNVNYFRRKVINDL